MRRIAAALLVVLAIAGCSSGTADTQPERATDSQTQAPVDDDPAVETPQELSVLPADVGQRIGCEGFHEVEATEIYSEGAGECKVDGHDVKVVTFSTNEARDSYVELGRANGARYVVGEGFAIEVDSPAAQKAVTSALS